MVSRDVKRQIQAIILDHYLTVEERQERLIPYMQKHLADNRALGVPLDEVFDSWNMFMVECLDEDLSEPRH